MWNCFEKRRRLFWKRKWDLLHNAGNLAPLCLIRICRLTRMSDQYTISYIYILAKYLVTAKSRWTNQQNDLTIARIITTYGHLPVFACLNFIPHAYLVYLHRVYMIHTPLFRLCNPTDCCVGCKREIRNLLTRDRQGKNCISAHWDVHESCSIVFRVWGKYHMIVL